MSAYDTGTVEQTPPSGKVISLDDVREHGERLRELIAKRWSTPSRYFFHHPELKPMEQAIRRYANRRLRTAA